MQMRKYYQEGAPPVPGSYYGQDPDAQEDESDLDGQAPPEQQEVAANAATMASQPEDGGSYLQPPDDGSAPFPGMPGVTTGGDMVTGPPSAPSAPMPPPLAQPSEYSAALKALSKVYDAYPQRKAPNWMERIAAGVLGGAAGYSNAARRAAPIDIGKTTEGILYPGYDSKLAAWQSKVVPAQQAVEIAGQQAAAGWKGQQIAAESALKGAQVDYYEKRGQYYGSLNQSRLVPVTPEIEKASANFYHVGQQITAAAAAKAYDDYVKSRAPRLLHQGDVLLGPDNQPLYSNAPKPTPLRTPPANTTLLGIRATGGTTGNPQIDAMSAADAKRAIEIGKDRSLADTFAQQRADEAKQRMANDTSAWKINEEQKIHQQRNQQLAALSGPNAAGRNVPAETQRINNEARAALQNIHDEYARRIRTNGGNAVDQDIAVDYANNPSGGDFVYKPRVAAPPVAAPVVRPQIPPHPGAPVVAPPPTGPVPIRRYNAAGEAVELRGGAWVPVPAQ